MATPDDFFPYIQPSLTSCPNQIARQAVMSSAIELCEDAQVWTTRAAPVPLVYGQAAYAITPPADARQVAVLNVWDAQTELKGKSFNEMTALVPGWQTVVGHPLYFVTDEIDDGFEVYPLPDAGAAGTSLIPRVAWAPSKDATTLPDVLLSRFVDSVAFGALARLMIMPRQPWSDPALAQYYEAKHKVELDSARIEQLHGRVVGSMRVATRAFGRTN
jgi:hypothetical protein